MKKLLSILTLCFLSICGFSQIDSQWSADMPGRQVPTGVDLTVHDTLSNPVSREFYIELGAAGLDDNDQDSAFYAIGDSVKVLIDSNYVEDTFKLNPDLDINMNIIITSIKRHFDNFDEGDYKNQYRVATNVFKIWGRVEWE